MSLYDDRTFEALQAEALADLNEKIDELPDSQKVDASEGSLLYMAIAKQAQRLEEAYGELDAVNDNMLVDTQDLEHLIDSGAESGVPIIEGTSAVVVGQFNCEVELGTEFSAIDSDYTYVATEFIESVVIGEATFYKYYLEADDVGVDPGAYRGDIEPEDFIDDFETGEIISCYTPGTEEEDEEEYRERRLNAYSSLACAGNRDYYVDTIDALAGVGGTKVYRREQGKAYIDCYIQAADFGVPTLSIVSFVKEQMDPTSNEGEGVGKCPFGHVLHVNAVGSETINVSASFVFDEDYSFSMLENSLNAAIANYILTLQKTWEESNSIIVRRSSVEMALLAVTGVLDVGDVLLNGDDENITITANKIPVKGTLTDSSEE